MFKKSVGLNGVGIKAVNALSSSFEISSFRDGKMKHIAYCEGNLTVDDPVADTSEANGTLVRFTPDDKLFRGFRYRQQFVVPLLKNYSFLNTGLTLNFNGQRYHRATVFLTSCARI